MIHSTRMGFSKSLFFFSGCREFYWVVLDVLGFIKVLLGFTGFSRVLLGFSGFHWGFTGFYRVLPSLTGYHEVRKFNCDKCVRLSLHCGFTGFY